MSFTFQRSEIKKDEEETPPPAREGDPLLPVGGRGGRSIIEDYTSTLENPSSRNSSLRSRRASRSPVLDPTSKGTTTTTTITQPSAVTTTATTANTQPIASNNSQMIHADDETSTTSTAFLEAAAAAAEHQQQQQHLQHNNTDSVADPHVYIDFSESSAVGDHESQASSMQAPQSLASSTQQTADDLLSQHHHQQHHRHRHHHLPPVSTIPRHPDPPSHQYHHPRLSQSQQPPQNAPPIYEPPPSYRPPSPDENRSQQDARSIGSSSQPPLLEIPEEIYAIRKAALKVLKPLTKTWIVISVGFSLSVLFGASRWTGLLPTVPYWFILLPCWSSHVGLLWLNILSAKALSSFIAEANDSRQRPDSRDHLNRTEYLPLLQRSLKFGLKTGILSFFVFIFEILIFIRLARGTISLTVAFVPLWLLVAGGIFDGLVCKTQHLLRVLCWILSFAAMTLLVLKVDYHFDAIRWRLIVCPVVAILSVASGNLIYIVYGHQIGFYKLTEAQLTAGNLYALAALICIILVVMIGEVIPLSRPVEVETKLFVVALSPLVVCLVGMGAWVVSRDEFSRLLLYGGQAAVHPKKLRWVPLDGWTCVQGKGVTVIPMFGEVNFRPLERKSLTTAATEMMSCCSQGCCYPYEEEDEQEGNTPSTYHPYLDPNIPRNHNASSFNALRGL